MPSKALRLAPVGTLAEKIKTQLRHYRGGSTVSALEAACVYYAGVKLLLPGQDPGREYGLARGMVGEGDS